MAIRIPAWTGRAILGLVGAVVVLVLVLSWMHANALRSALMVPRVDDPTFDLTVASNGAGRVVINRTDQTDREGVWGLEGTAAYAQVSTIVRVTEESVERGILPMIGELTEGDAARIDADAYQGDPESALGIGWKPLRTPSDIGPHDAWFVDGRRATWVIFVHGRGNDRLDESLRVIPSLAEQGFPVLVISYRNDVNATPSESGLRYWGIEEWHDLDAAVELAVLKGAKDVVIIGSGFGASIVSMFLHESDDVDLVKGVIYDSPVLDIESVAVDYARDEGTPAVISWLGRNLASIRFGLDWAALDQIERAKEFDVPILLLYGAKDPVTDVAQFEAFASAIPDLVTTEAFAQGGHADLWNVDAPRYESAIADFLLETAGPE
ncbi:MAG: alpha/beta hydrolase [Acidimicrobiia bacterium]|nr:alpha/beta hydrolase [Acidimicrobiia bacterium]